MFVGPARPAPFDAGVLRRGRDLREAGVEPARGGWHQVRHGVWVTEHEWRALTPGHQHAALVHATALCLERERPVFALTSAAAVWGLPRIEAWPDAVRVLTAHEARGRGSALVRPHVGRAAAAVERGGVMVTSVARTVVDLARTGSLHTAVAAADHALRYDLCTTEQLTAEVDAVPSRVRGRRTARLVVALADPLSMSPGESLSRVQMYLLNLPRPELQRKVEDAQGLVGFVDFGWDGVVGEFDGQVKYRVAEDGDPRQASEVLWQEKQREDRLRRLAEVARWTWAVAMDRRRLGALLASHGIHPLPTNTWLPSTG
ncbi:hypothetical protein GCM10023168_27800 [Fodinibacter luteus]|uniref:Transcriptional regulator, AbiEi antitoxin, Type IV TA system n=1 Tax=Fodinibacter luteus TaxID=552064 RepID=A0ABP8KLF9_9MICO